MLIVRLFKVDFFLKKYSQFFNEFWNGPNYISNILGTRVTINFSTNIDIEIK